MSLGLRRVSPVDAPDASGLLTTATQVGQVLGVAVSGSVSLARAGSGAGEAGWTTACGLAIAATAGLVGDGLPATRLTPPTTRTPNR
ncbi:hypothetical protein LO772_04350 [Yinghuangia sp. ASG 101]|uniref:hypothetical protein n=1 Tax=Yinghuangia sp. ASG 101 TaxID=2896848 RepID=UPI001E3BED65|nr:hypothetical protein [Yinghuangia sp. ASG 101]UGQ12857.1 hypothetical protein LO772_04350 [Yinghuangia sp. ASG 101]